MRVPEVLAFYHWHGEDQVSSNKWRQVVDSIHARNDFIHNYPQLVEHIPQETIKTLGNKILLTEAYRCYWERNLINAQRLFRTAIKNNYWNYRDLKYILPAMLPTKLYQATIRIADSISHTKKK